jgi:hypothetical protein
VQRERDCGGTVSVLSAFIDESGVRAITPRSSDYFVMAAAIYDDTVAATIARGLTSLRADLDRQPTDPLSWKNIRTHEQRLRIAQVLAVSPITITSVVVCKRFLSAPPLPSEHHAYLYTLRFLLERLSWLARDQGTTLSYTLSYITRFQIASLRDYEARLKGRQDCQIAWANIAAPGRIDQPNRVESLQLADLAASAIGKAFEPDKWGNTERRYLEELSPRLYRHGSGPNRLTSYGLKMHPWHQSQPCQDAHPWINDL